MTLLHESEVDGAPRAFLDAHAASLAVVAKNVISGTILSFHDGSVGAEKMAIVAGDAGSAFDTTGRLQSNVIRSKCLYVLGHIFDSFFGISNVER